MNIREGTQFSLRGTTPLRYHRSYLYDTLGDDRDSLSWSASTIRTLYAVVCGLPSRHSVRIIIVPKKKNKTKGGLFPLDCQDDIVS